MNFKHDSEDLKMPIMGIFNNKSLPMEQENKPCRTAHTVNGKVPTTSDTNLNNSICDCGRFIVNIQGCNCNRSLKVVLKPNMHYNGTSIIK